MFAIKDERSGIYYKTKTSIKDETLRMLYSFPFIKAGVITQEESMSKMKCVDKFPFFKEIGKIDGRSKLAHELPWFTWSLAIN